MKSTTLNNLKGHKSIVSDELIQMFRFVDKSSMMSSFFHPERNTDTM